MGPFPGPLILSSCQPASCCFDSLTFVNFEFYPIFPLVLHIYYESLFRTLSSNRPERRRPMDQPGKLCKPELTCPGINIFKLDYFQHYKFIRQSQDIDPEVIFIGDSLIQYMQLTSTWMKWFVPMHALNFGIGGDQTQHVLWRIQNGEFDHCRPKVSTYISLNSN